MNSNKIVEKSNHQTVDNYLKMLENAFIVYKAERSDIKSKNILKTLGKYFPNTPMLAAIVKISKIMEEEKFIQEMEASLSHKFAKKPEVLEGNMQALRLAMQEVRGDE